MSLWNQDDLAVAAGEDADLYQQAIPCVKRRLLRQQRLKALAVGWALAAFIAVMIGLLVGSIETALIILGLMGGAFTFLFVIDYLRLAEEKRRQRWLAAELDKEVEVLRRQQRKLKRDRLYRVGDDGELVEVEADYLADEPAKRKRNA
jgi:hypothetical protein